ncbi:hypothetical protein [Methylobacterium phyllostachyos]
MSRAGEGTRAAFGGDHFTGGYREGVHASLPKPLARRRFWSQTGDHSCES